MKVRFLRVGRGLPLAAMMAMALAAGSLPAADDAPGVMLEYRFEPNEFLRYQVSHQMTITTRLQETSETARNQSVSQKYLRVVSVSSDGTAVIEPVIEHVNMTARFGDHEPVHFDSGPEGPHPKQFSDVLNSVGKPLVRLTVKPNGELVNVVKLNEQGNDSAAAAKADDPNQNFLVVLPESPVRIGESWKDRLETTVQFGTDLTRKVTLQRTYTLDAVEDNVAKIRLKTACLSPIQDPGVNAQLIQKLPTGEIEFDIERGRILSRTLDIDQTEIGVFGANSVMHAVSHRVEKLRPQAAAAQQTSGTTER